VNAVSPARLRLRFATACVRTFDETPAVTTADTRFVIVCVSDCMAMAIIRCATGSAIDCMVRASVRWGLHSQAAER
jgi:hypothetical protein